MEGDLILLMDKDDNNLHIETVGDECVSAVLDGRVLYKDGRWNTLCLPFDIADFEGTPLKEAIVKELDVSTSAYDDKTGILTLSFSDALTSIEAGKPYLVKWSDGENIINPSFANVSITCTTPQTIQGTKVSFIGTYSPAMLVGGWRNLYMGSSNKLYYPGDEGYQVNAFRGYFAVDTNEEVKTIFLNLDDDDTDIVQDVETRGNGENALWYDLSGRRITQEPIMAGVYIYKGRKIIVK